MCQVGVSVTLGEGGGGGGRRVTVGEGGGGRGYKRVERRDREG